MSEVSSWSFCAAEDFVSQRNAHIVVSLPGIVRGNHYHTKGLETITILGPSLVRFRDQGKIEEVVVPDKEAYRFVFRPGVSHAIKNLSREANILVTFTWSMTQLIRTDMRPAYIEGHTDLRLFGERMRPFEVTNGNRNEIGSSSDWLQFITDFPILVIVSIYLKHELILAGGDITTGMKSYVKRNLKVFKDRVPLAVVP